MLSLFRGLSKRDLRVISGMWADLFRLDNELIISNKINDHFSKMDLINDYEFAKLTFELHASIVIARKEKIFSIISFYEDRTKLNYKMIGEWLSQGKITETDKELFESYLSYREDPLKFVAKNY